ncbi:hypothetical protein SAMN05421781_0101 [Marinococcus luteus]|uniref:Uncharacterized protein n=1 Tax=Marinococcus luteus TaxID=1122204 RepID=A0A1H2Q2Q6_9BACI|nr:hypothetical protein [Marinococcus luteus]SDW01098.1 hypothetical protein SAMN05421781_0101 [Marinococcus luteus]
MSSSSVDSSNFIEVYFDPSAIPLFELNGFQSEGAFEEHSSYVKAVVSAENCSIEEAGVYFYQEKAQNTSGGSRTLFIPMRFILTAVEHSESRGPIGYTDPNTL